MLVGLIEAAEIMGEDIQTIKKLYKHGKFPKAIEEHDRGPAWTREQIEHYKKVQGSNMTVYYHDGRQMWKLKINAPRELFDKTLNEFVDELCTARKKMAFTILHKKQVDYLISCVNDPDLARLLNPGTVAAYYNYGLLSDEEYLSYIKCIESGPHPLGTTELIL